VEHQVRKAFIHFCFDDEDSLEDDIDHRILAELAQLEALRYCLWGVHRQWDSSWERMLEDGTYMSDDEFLSNFWMNRSCIMQLNSLVEDDEVFQRVLGKVGKWASMLHVMVLLKFLGSYENAAAMQKIGHMMGISKSLVMTMSCVHVMPSWNIVSGWSSGQVSMYDRTSVAGLERFMGLLIALGRLMVHCFLWLLHPR